jgi:hypothetical protein
VATRVDDLPPHEHLLGAATTQPPEETYDAEALFTQAYTFLFQHLRPQFVFHAPLFESSAEAFQTAFYFYLERDPRTFQDMLTRPEIYLQMLSDPEYYIDTPGPREHRIAAYFANIRREAA